MKTYETIEVVIENQVAGIYMNRPERHNAFNHQMIREIIDALKTFNDPKSGIRAITLEGRGKSFCAGVDLNWMKATRNAPFDEIYEGSMDIAECMHAIYSSKVPTIAKVHGGAFGGATGLLSSCDMVYTIPETVFSLSEVKIGLVPACIAPYVIKRVGETRARELMISGMRINGQKAAEYNLANECIPKDEFEDFIQKRLGLIKTGGPEAIALCKRLIHDVSDMELVEAKAYTAKMITEIRLSDEGQEGMSAFLEKRKPAWVEKS